MSVLPRFNDPALLHRALTHTSYANELAQEKLHERVARLSEVQSPEDQSPDLDAAAIDDNQRLEFLGDALLDFVSGAWLFVRYPQLNEGRLTSLRAALVRASTLAQFAEQVGLPEHVRLGKGELETGGKKRSNILSDAFEALLGALYLDQGLDAVKGFVEPLLEQWATAILAENLDRDSKTLLQEWSQETLSLTPRYKLAGTDGPPHKRIFHVEVWLGETMAATGEGASKKSAEQMAAREALNRRPSVAGG